MIQEPISPSVNCGHLLGGWCFGDVLWVRGDQLLLLGGE